MDKLRGSGFRTKLQISWKFRQEYFQVQLYFKDKPIIGRQRRGAFISISYDQKVWQFSLLEKSLILEMPAHP